jgi:hypothetical protein
MRFGELVQERERIATELLQDFLAAILQFQIVASEWQVEISTGQ